MPNAIPDRPNGGRRHDDRRRRRRRRGIARRSLERRGADYAGEVRRLLDAALDVMRRVRHDAAAPGSPTSWRPPGCRTTPSTGTSRPRTRWSRPSSRTAPSGCRATSPTRWPRRRRPRARSAAGSRACWPRPPTRTSPRPRSPCCGTAAAWARGCRRAARRPAGPLATLLREPFAELGSADPDLDASLAAHAVVGTLSDYLWDRARPSAADDRPRRRRLPRRRHGGDEDAAMTFHLFLPQMRMPLDAIVERALAAEAAGFEGIALMDHLAPPLAAQHDMWEAMTAATWLLARTRVARRGPPRPVRPAAAPGGARPPGGHPRPRLGRPLRAGHRLGLGARRARHLRRGARPRPRERVARLGESLDVMRALWTGEPVTYDGRFFRLRDAQQRPAPTRPIPIVVGGVGPRGRSSSSAPTPTGGTCRSTRSTGSTSCSDRVGDARVSVADHGGAGADRGRPGRGHRARRPPLRRLGHGGRRRRRHARRARRRTSPPCGPAGSSGSTSGSPTSPRPRPSPASARSSPPSAGGAGRAGCVGRRPSPWRGNRFRWPEVEAMGSACGTWPRARPDGTHCLGPRCPARPGCGSGRARQSVPRAGG